MKGNASVRKMQDMLWWPEPLVVLILPITFPILRSLIPADVKVLSSLLIWYYPERSAFHLSSKFWLSVAKSFPKEQKNLVITFEISCLLTMLLMLLLSTPLRFSMLAVFWAGCFGSFIEELTDSLPGLVHVTLLHSYFFTEVLPSESQVKIVLSISELSVRIYQNLRIALHSSIFQPVSCSN